MRRGLFFVFLFVFLHAAAAFGQPPSPTQCVTTVAAGGTGDQIQFPAIPCWPTTTLVIMKAGATNTTTTPAISVNGGPFQTITNFDGTPLSVGLFQPGQYRLLSYNGTNWLALSAGAVFNTQGLAVTSMNATLKAIVGATNGQTIYRAGFNAAGDGGGALYAFTSANCSISGGDNGSQVQPTTGTGCWNIATAQYWYPVKVWGAVCDGSTDDTAAIAAAVSAVGNMGGGKLYFPSGQTCVDKGTIAVTKSGVWLTSSNFGGLTGAILFENGSSDSIDFGGQASQINGGGIDNLFLNHSGKTGGNAISIINVGSLTVRNTTISGAWNGVFDEHTNTITFDNDVINTTTAGNSYGIKWYGLVNGTDHSDVLAFINTVVQMSNSGGDCYIIDGDVATPVVHTMRLLGCAYGLHIENSQGTVSVGRAPRSGYFHALEIDGGTKSAVKIDSGRAFTFVGGDLNSIADTTAGDYVFDVEPDESLVRTADIIVNGTYIHDAPGGIAELNAKDIQLTGVRLGDGGHVSTSTPTIDVGANADHVTITGSRIGEVFGQPNTNNYSIQVENGAGHVLACSNDYSQNGGVGTANNLGSGNNFTLCPIGVAYDGSPLQPASYSAVPGNPTGTTSTTGVMMGLAGSFNPQSTGNMTLTISGSVSNNTAGDGVVVQCRYGTGTAPVNGAALTGTSCGSAPLAQNPSGGTISVPFSVGASGLVLTKWTPYWFDIGLTAVTGGTATVQNISISAVEH